jgi:mannose-6-phosphate isomerase-like protein (cupin superfamily)
LSTVSFPEPDARPSAVWRSRAEVEQAGPVRLLAPGDAVGGEFGLFETSVQAGRMGAVPHYHRSFSESFYVLSGRLAIMSGREWRVAGSGDFAYVPAEGVHAFRALGDEDARFLILFVPAGVPRERYFRGLAEFARRETPPTDAEVDEFALTCDQVNLRDWVSEPHPE